MINVLNKIVFAGFIVISFNLHATEKIDLIIQGEFVVTMDAGKPLIEDGAIAIEKDKIIAVESSVEILSRYRAEKIISGQGRVLMPGLINGHTHSSMTLFRGVADDLKLMSWLNDYIFPLEGRFVSPEFVKTGTELACWEMIRGGTTTFVDMYFYPDTIADVVDRCGLRAIIASPAIDYPSPGFKGWDDAFAEAQAFVQRWQGKNKRITPAFAPHSPYTVSPEHLRQTVAAARQFRVPVSMHIAEAPAEVAYVDKHYQTTPVNHVSKLGLLDITLIGAHMVHLNSRDIKQLVGRQVGAIHNPTSNLKLASGIAPVPEMLQQGVLVGLGTDGAASNNDLDLWEEMRLAALLHKQAQQDPTVIPAQVALEMATSGGAAAIGLHNIGQLKVGMQADIIQVSLDSPRLSPLYNVVSHLVYVTDSTDVVTTVVAGRVLMDNGEVISMDGEKIKVEANAKAMDIVQALSR